MASRARGPLGVFPVEAGGCSDCAMELEALFASPYRAHAAGIRLVETPLHADLLLVSGAVTVALRAPLLRAYEAMPAPKLVVALGACACGGGLLRGGGQIAGPLAAHLPVEVFIPGCPPGPPAILHGLLLAAGRARPRLRRGRILRPTIG